MKKINGYIIIIAILTITVIGLGSYIVYDKVQENKKAETKIENKETTNDITNSYDIYTTDNLSIRNYYEPHGGNKIIINTDKYKNKEIAKNITYQNTLDFNLTDSCNANRWLIMVDTNKNVTALNIDSLLCYDELITKDITEDLKTLGVKTIKTTFQTNTYNSKSKTIEPKVYAITNDEVVIDITSILKNN